MYCVPLGVKCPYGCSNEGGKKGLEGGERVEIALALVCRRLGLVWRVGGRPEGIGRTFSWYVEEV